jgi:hypothetical protein
MTAFAQRELMLSFHEHDEHGCIQVECYSCGQLDERPCLGLEKIKFPPVLWTVVGEPMARGNFYFVSKIFEALLLFLVTSLGLTRFFLNVNIYNI